MRKKGFTLIEVIMVIALMGIVMLIFSPLLSAFVGAQDRLHNQSKVDSRLNEVVEFIKRDVRNAKSATDLGGEPIEVFDVDSVPGQKVVIYTIDLDGNSKYVQYALDDSNLKLNSSSTFAGLSSASRSTVLSDIEDCEFKYEDKILLFYFKIDVPERLEGKIRNEVRDVGITRINL